MDFIKEEKGVTLLEILISITILSIIFLSFMSLFPQMGMINSRNEDKAQAINTAKEILVDWQESSKVKQFLKNKVDPYSDFSPNNNTEKVYFTSFDHSDPTYYKFNIIRNDYTVNIKIKRTSELTSIPSKAHLIHIKLLDKNGITVSETYGYVIV